MPWTVDDVERHNKGLTAKQKRQWVHVANGALEAGDDDGTAITKANGVVKKSRIQEHIEGLLYKKISAMIETVVMQQIASVFEGALDNQPEGVLKQHGWKATNKAGDRTIYTHPTKQGHEIHVDSHGGFRHYDGDKCLQAGFTGEKLRKHLGEAALMEADPRPRVEKDINGKPVIPNKAQYHQYFSDMHHEHIKRHLSDAKTRWAQAAKEHEAAKAAAEASRSKADKERALHAHAHLKAIGAEMSAGNAVLKMKQKKLKQKSLATKKFKKGYKSKAGLVKTGSQMLFGKSKMATSIAKHISDRLLQRHLDKINKQGEKP
jgi:hypothetical protein